jgi:hypothetical protein
MPSRKVVKVLAWVLGVPLAGCSSATLDETGANEQLGEQSLALEPLQSVRVYRPSGGLVLSIRALDSQNALPSGALSDPSVVALLAALGREPLLEESSSVSALRSLPGGQGSTLLTYVARCALKESDPPVLRDAPGRLGLAPDWRRRALNTSEQHWITACLMAHTNNLAEVAVAVSGTRAVLLTAGSSPGPAQSFPYEEAAFYGNVFANTPELYACSGAGAQSRCDDRGVGQDLERRICGTNSAKCGFKYLGKCNLPALAGGGARPGACTVSMPYANCGGSTGARFSEIVTASLRTDAALLALHPRCGQQPAPSCAPPHHDVCTLGPALGAGCSTGVCAHDDYCCTIAWDSNCVEAAREAGACP